MTAIVPAPRDKYEQSSGPITETLGSATTRPEQYKTHSELQHTKIKTHHYIETAILRLYKL